MNGTLKIDNWILASVIKQVLVGGHTVVGQKLGKSICATSVHQVSQEFNIFWSELILVLQVYIDKVPKKRASKKNITYILIANITNSSDVFPILSSIQFEQLKKKRNFL